MNSIPRREARAIPSSNRLLDDPEGSSVDSVGAETPISRQAWQLSRAVACSCRTSASRDHRQDLGSAATARRPQTATHAREHEPLSERWTFFYDYRAAGRAAVSDDFWRTLSRGGALPSFSRR